MRRRRNNASGAYELGLGGCIVMLDASTGVQKDPSAGKIAVWGNIADPSTPAIQPTGSVQPEYGLDSAGYPAVIVSAASPAGMYANVPYFLGKLVVQTPFTFVLVGTFSSHTGTKYPLVIGSASSTGEFGWSRSTTDDWTILDSAGKYSAYSVGSVSVSSKNFLAFSFSPALSRTSVSMMKYRNGAVTLSGAPSPSAVESDSTAYGYTTTGKVQLLRAKSTSPNLYCNEILMYNRTLSVAELTNLYLYLKGKWGTV